MLLEMIDVLTLNYNDAETTIHFVNSVKDYESVSHILVVDNNSTDDSLSKLSLIENDKIRILVSEKNGGYGAGNNLGIRFLKENFNSKYILLSNPDVMVDESVLIDLEKFFQNHSDYTIAAPFMLNAKMERQYNTAFKIPKKIEYILSFEVFFSKFLKPFYYPDILEKLPEIKNVGAVSGSLFMMNVDRMMKYGMFDERFFLYCEELVLGKKLKDSNQKIALLPKLTFIHNHSASINKTYKTNLAKQRMLMNSKIFFFKEYLNANVVEIIIAKCLSKLSLLEVLLISLFSNRRCRQ